MYCSFVQCSEVHCSAVQCSALQCSEVHCSAVGGGAQGQMESGHCSQRKARIATGAEVHGRILQPPHPLDHRNPPTPHTKNSVFLSIFSLSSVWGSFFLKKV